VQHDNFTSGALRVVAASAAFAGMGVFIKLASATLSNEMIVFLRNAFGLLFLLPWLMKLRLSGLKTQRWRLHLFRTIAGLSAMYCFFYTIGHLNLADAVLLNYSIPIFTPVIAYFWLREQVSLTTGWAILIGFVGIACILRPGLNELSLASFTGVGSGVLAAVALTSIRRLSVTEPTTRIVFYFGVFSLLLSILPVLWLWKTPTLQEIIYMLAVGALATAGQLLISSGYARAPVNRISVFTYTAVVWAALYSWMLWDDAPLFLSVIGTLLVVIAGVVVSRQPRQPSKVT